MNTNNDYLFEGQVERLNTCKIVKDSKIFMLVEQHYDKRLKKDRNYVDQFKIGGLTTNNFKRKTIAQIEKVYPQVAQAWQSKYGKLLDATPEDKMPRLVPISFLVRVVFPINVTNDKLNTTFNYAIEVCTKCTYGTVFSTNTSLYSKLWSEGGFEGINKALIDASPSEYAPHYANGNMGFDKPYLFIETTVPCLIHVNNVPHGFAKVKYDIDFPAVYAKPTELTPAQWDAMLEKAKNLPDMNKNNNIQIRDIRSTTPIKEFYSKFFEDGFFNNF